MPDNNELMIRTVDPSITTFSIPFNRFAPLGRTRHTFIAVGNRMTAIRLHDNRVLLLNPIPLTSRVKTSLIALGGVHLLACDLGHHMYVKQYLDVWPDAQAIGVRGLERKRKDVKWDFLCAGDGYDGGPEKYFDFRADFETVCFEGFITRCVAWWHRPSGTLIQSDLLMNLPCTEQYSPPSSEQDVLSRMFGTMANPRSVWMKCLIYYVANVDYAPVRRDAKKVTEWNLKRIITCHGDIIETEPNEAWTRVYAWYLEGSPEPSFFNRMRVPFMRLMRWVFLM